MPPKSDSVHPRKRPRQARAEATVDAIVEAAARILSAEGLMGFNTNSVARVAGVSVGSLYQYFPSKEAILAEMLRRKQINVLSALEAASTDVETKTADQALRDLARAGLLHQPRTLSLAQALDYASAVLPLHEQTHEINKAIVACVGRFLTAMDVPANAQMIAAQDITGMARGMILQALRGGTAVDDDALAERVFMAVKGYLNEVRKKAGTDQPSCCGT